MSKPPGGLLLRKTRLQRKRLKSYLRRRFKDAERPWSKPLIGCLRVDLRNARSRRMLAAIED